jgi:hypothetical protein
LQFNDYQLIKTIDTSETLEIGQLTPKNNSEIAHIRLCMFKTGTMPSNTTATCNIHTSSDLTTAYASSTAVTMLDAEAADELNTSTAWISWIRFDFARENLNKNISYYVSLTTANYTRSGDTFYMGVAYGYPYPTYDPSSNILNYTDGPLAMQWFAYQDPP